MIQLLQNEPYIVGSVERSRRPAVAIVPEDRQPPRQISFAAVVRDDILIKYDHPHEMRRTNVLPRVFSQRTSLWSRLCSLSTRSNRFRSRSTRHVNSRLERSRVPLDASSSTVHSTTPAPRSTRSILPSLPPLPPPWRPPEPTASLSRSLPPHAGARRLPGALVGRKDLPRPCRVLFPILISFFIKI